MLKRLLGFVFGLSAQQKAPELRMPSFDDGLDVDDHFARETKPRSFEERQAALMDALELLHFIPETHALLQRAKKDGLTIELNDKLLGKMSNARHEPVENRISVNPQTSPEHLPSSLAHELRHYYQHKILDWGKDKDTVFCHATRTPRTAVMIQRMLEGDAFAFQALMDVKIEKAQKMRAMGMTAEQSRNKMSGIQKANTMLEVKILRERFQKTQKGLEPYDVKMLTVVAQLFEMDPIDGYKKRYAVPLDDPKISIRHLRQIFRTGVEGNAPNYLSGMSDKRLMQTMLASMEDEARKAMWAMEVMDRVSQKPITAESVEMHMQKVYERVVEMQKALKKRNADHSITV